MRSTSRRASNFDINEVHSNKANSDLMTQPFNIDLNHDSYNKNKNNNLNGVVSGTSGASASPLTSNAALNATTTTTTPAATVIPPMVSIAKTTLQDKNAFAAMTTTTTKATSKNASSYIEQRRQSQAANITLISLVRRRPWLYDNSHSYYAKKHLIEKTWAQIGKTVGETGAICKERWRNIRAAFARSINIYKTQSGPNRLKPYYLHRELQFLINPMTKGRKEQKKSEDSSTDESSINGEGDGAYDLDLKSEKDERESDEDGKSAVTTVEGKNESETETQQQATPTSIASVTNANGNNNDTDESDIETPVRKRRLDCNDLSRQLTRLKKDRFEDIPDDADLLFVKSLYYDMSNLDVAQKLRLKKSIYGILEQTTSPTQTTTTKALVTPLSNNFTTPPRPPPQPTQPVQPSLSAAQKLSFNLIRALDETKLQTLNQFICQTLAPHSLTNNNNNQQAGRLVQNISNSKNLHGNPVQRIPNTSRLAGTTDHSNGGLGYSFTVKEESLDDLANMLYPPSY